MVPQDGVIVGTTQTSTLSLSSSQLEKLKTAGGGNRAHTFTCRIAVGDLNTAVTATQTINIYTPGITQTFTRVGQKSVYICWVLYQRRVLY